MSSPARDAVTLQVPTPVVVSVDPVSAHGPVGVPKDRTPVPDPPEATSVVVSPNDIVVALSNRTDVCAAFATVKVTVCGLAAEYCPSPSCVACSWQEPAPVIDTVRPFVPDTWHTDVVSDDTTGARPLDAVGATGNAAAP